MRLTLDQEVVAQRHDDANVRLEDQPAQHPRERCLHVDRAQREQLFELVDDDENAVLATAQPLKDLECHVVLLEAQQIAHSVGVAGHERRQGVGHRLEWPGARCRHHCVP